jgi:hypothetical protein
MPEPENDADVTVSVAGGVAEEVGTTAFNVVSTGRNQSVDN